MMNDSNRSERNLWAGTVLLAAVVTGIDSLAPPALNAGVVYVSLVLLSLWSRRQSFTYIVAVAATCLVSTGMFYGLAGGLPTREAIVNRMLAVGVIWSTALVCALRQKKMAGEFQARRERQRTLAENRELQQAKVELEQKSRELAATRDVAVYTIAKVAESRDPETGQHLERIRAYSQILALELQKEPVYARVIDRAFLENLYRSSPLHDIGKVGISDEILLKPGEFTVEEYESMKQHTLIGVNILEDAIGHHRDARFMEMAAVIARCHHERFDGQGYPAGLSGAAIPLAARIVAVADVFDALASERPYKQAYSPHEARKIIENESGRQFDPAVVEAFKRRFADFLQAQLKYPNKHVRIFGVTDSILAEVCG